MINLVGIARAQIQDCCGEDVIAFPEIAESLSQKFDVDTSTAVSATRTALTEYINENRIRIFLGRYDAHDFPEINGRDLEAVLENDSHYIYGDGDEVRAWFSLEC